MRRDSVPGAWRLCSRERSPRVLRLSLCLLLWVLVGFALLDACSHRLREVGCLLVCGFRCLNGMHCLRYPVPPPRSVCSARHPPTSVLRLTDSPPLSHALVMEPAASLSRGSPGSVPSPPRPAPPCFRLCFSLSGSLHHKSPNRTK